MFNPDFKTSVYYKHDDILTVLTFITIIENSTLAFKWLLIRYVYTFAVVATTCVVVTSVENYSNKNIYVILFPNFEISLIHKN